MTLPSILRLWINENVNNVKSLDYWRKFDHNHWLGKIFGLKLMTVVADWYSGSIYLQFPGNECLIRSLRSSNLTVYYPTEYVYSFVMLYSVEVKLLFGFFLVLLFFFFFLGGGGGGGMNKAFRITHWSLFLRLFIIIHINYLPVSSGLLRCLCGDFTSKLNKAQPVLEAQYIIASSFIKVTLH